MKRLLPRILVTEKNSVSAVFHLISSPTSRQMVNSANGWAHPVRLISFLTTSLFLAFPGSLSHLFNDLYSFISLLPTEEERKVRSSSFTDRVVCCHFPVVSDKFKKIELHRLFPLGSQSKPNYTPSLMLALISTLNSNYLAN